MRVLEASALVALSGCAASFEFPPRQREPIILPAGERVVETKDAEVIEPAPALMCQARARHFRGTVSVPCEDIARIIAP